MKRSRTRKLSAFLAAMMLFSPFTQGVSALGSPVITDTSDIQIAESAGESKDTDLITDGESGNESESGATEGARPNENPGDGKDPDPAENEDAEQNPDPAEDDEELPPDEAEDDDDSESGQDGDDSEDDEDDVDKDDETKGEDGDPDGEPGGSEEEVPPATEDILNFIGPMAGTLVTNGQQLRTALEQGGQVELFVDGSIRLDREISLSGSADITISAANAATPAVIYAPSAGGRHFTIQSQANVTLALNGLALDGENVAGGIHVKSGATLVVEGNYSVVRNCNSDKEEFGGAMQLDTADYVEVNGLEFRDNYALQYGGSISVRYTEALFNNVTIQDSLAGYYGGGIYVMGASEETTIKGSTIRNNVAIRDGGGIFMNNTRSVLNLLDSTVSSNNSVNGGGLYFNAVESTANITRSNITDNRATSNGGGIYLGKGKVNMQNSTVDSNNATEYGGGVMMYDDGFTDHGSTFHNNQAKNGGAIFSNNFSVVSLNNSTVSGNTATEHGGGIAVYPAYHTMLWQYIKLDRVVFSGNRASSFVSVPAPANQATHDQYIKNTVTHSGTDTGLQFSQAYNNYDVINPEASYQLVYHANGGTFTGGSAQYLDPNQYGVGASAEIAAQIPTWPGYRFLGWATSKTGKAPQYTYEGEGSTSNSLTISSAQTLYAVWEEEPVHTVNFDVNGILAVYEAQFEDGSTQQRLLLEAGQTITPPEEPTQYGYEFVGWYTKSGGKAQDNEYRYSARETDWGEKWIFTGDNADLMPANDLDLYARWEEVAFPVSSERQLNIAMSSNRPIIDIRIIDDLKLNDAMRAERMLSGAVINISSADRQVKRITQTTNMRHFYWYGDTIYLNLDHIIADSDSGYGGIEAAGGTIHLNGNGNSTITGSTEFSLGGGIYLYGGDHSVANLEVSGNTAQQLGGGIYVGGETKADFDNLTITNNTSRSNGGGLAIRDKAAVTIRNSKITNNAARTAGGGISIAESAASECSMNEVILDGNTAADFVNVLSEADQVLINSAAIGKITGVSAIPEEDNPGGITFDNIYNNYDLGFTHGIHRVTYDANGGTGELLPDYNHYGTGAKATVIDQEGLVPPTNQKLAGWSTSVNPGESDKLYQTRDLLPAINGNVTLYAQWTRPEWTVTFDANGGEFAEGVERVDKLSVQVLNGNVVTSPEEPVREGYLFQGWYTKEEGDEYVFAPVNEDITVYAQWEKIPPKVFSVVYHANGGSTVPSVSVTEGEATSVPTPPPTRTGYTFVGWFKDLDTLQNEWDFDWTVEESMTEDGVLHLYAKWTAINVPVTMTAETGGKIFYQINGGDEKTIESGESETEYLIYEDTISVVAESDDEYRFTNWTAESGSLEGNLSNPRQEATGLTEAVAIEAKFEQIQYTLTYNVNGGEEPAPDAIRGISGTLVEVPSQGDMAAPQNHIFAGWNTQADGSGANYMQGEGNNSTFTLVKDTTLYAQWIRPERELTFHANGGEFTGEDDPSTITRSVLNGNVADRPQEPTREKHLFIGWYEDEDATLPYSFGPVTKGDDVYAGWEPIPPAEYTVVYHSNGGTAVEAGAVTEGTAIGSAPTPEPERLGYEFSGWLDHKGNEWDFAREVNENHVTNNVLHLYAKWTPIEIQVTLKAEAGGSIEYQIDGKEPITIASDTELTFPLNYEEKIRAAAKVKDSTYRFVGWKAESGQLIGILNNPVQEASGLTDGVTLVAQFEQIRYEVAFDANGGANPPASVNKIVGEEIMVPDGKEMTAPVNYRFFDWNTVPDGSGDPYEAGASFALEKDLTLYAQWERPTWTVTFNAGEGLFADGSSTTEKLVQNGNMVTYPDEPSREGHLFLGWFKDGAEYVFEPVTANFELKAQWEAIPEDYVVVYHANGGTSVAAADIKEGEKISKPDDPTRIGYQFEGWFTDPKTWERKWDFEKPVEKSHVTDNILHLYAKWVANEVTITLKAQKGGSIQYEINGDPRDTIIGEDLVKVTGIVYEDFISVSAVNDTDYRFVGWSAQSGDEEGTLSKPQQETSGLLEDVILEAQFEQITYVLTYDANGGEKAPEPKTAAMGQAIQAAEPTNMTGPAYYEFTGWNTQADGDGKVYLVGDPVMMTGDQTLYAQWERPQWKVTFDANDGLFEHGEESSLLQFVQNGASAAYPNEPELERHVFAGWYLKDGDANYVPYDFGPVTADVQVYAKWEEIPPSEYIVVFHANGGTAVSSVKVTENEQVPEPAEPTRTGYEFKGWDTAVTGGSKWNFDMVVTEQHVTNNTLHLYADWEAVKVSVSLIAETGGAIHYEIDGVEAGMVDAGDSKLLQLTYNNTISIEALREDEYRFDGWDVKSVSQTGTLSSAKQIASNLTEDIELTARFTEITYTLTYNINGGSGTAPVDVSGISGTQIPVPAQGEMAAPTNYVFEGWNTKADGTGDEYVNPAVFTLKSDATLYAQWSRPIRKVSFDANGGQFDSDSLKIVKNVWNGNTVSYPAEPTRDGHYFVGWYTDDAEAYVAEPVTKDIDLFAKWEPIPREQYIVVYHSNGGTSVASESVEEGSLVSKPNDPQKTGYGFEGWYTADNILWDFTDSVEKDHVTDNILHLYAKWNANEVTITLTAQEGGSIKYEINGDPRDTIIGETTAVETGIVYEDTISVYAISDSDYRFVGWDAKSGDEEGILSNPQQETSGLLENVTLTARFERIKYVLTYDANGGENAPGPVTVTAKEEIPVAEPIDMTGPTYYEFTGWNTQADGTGAAYSVGQSIMLTGDLTLYARWERPQREVTFDANGGLFGENETLTQSVQNGASATYPIEPKLEQYAFVGWYEDQDNLTQKYGFGPVTEDTTVYAKWERVQADYTVHFHTNGGTASSATQVGVKEGNAIDPKKIPSTTRTNYEFAGWFTDDGNWENLWDNERAVTANDVVNGVLHLYAYWLPKEVTLTLQAENGGSIIYQIDGGNPVTVDDDNEETAVTLNYDNHISVTAISKEEYYFTGWEAESGSLNGILSNPQQEAANLTKDVKLVATFEQIKYTLTYDGNGGTGTIAPQMEVSGTPIVLPDPQASGLSAPTTNYVFAGWNTSADGLEGENYLAGAEYVLTADITLYAQWVRPIWTVTFDANGGFFDGSEETLTQSVRNGASATYPAEPERYGYLFQGWHDSEGNSYEFGPVKSDTTVFAQWEPLNYTAVFHSNGGSTIAPVSASFFEPIGATAAQTTRTGYTFKGWYLDNDSWEQEWNLEEDTPAAGQLNSDNYLHLYAKWEIDTTTITLAAEAGGAIEYQINGANDTIIVEGGNSITLPVSYDDVIIATAFAEESGYQFSTWDVAIGEVRSQPKRQEMTFANLTEKAKAVASFATSQHLVQFWSSEGGEEIYSKWVVHGWTIDEPDLETNEESVDYWYYYNDEQVKTRWDFADGVTSSLDLYPQKKERQFTVKFDITEAESGKLEFYSAQVAYGDTVTVPLVEEELFRLYYGAATGSWFFGNTLWNFSDPVVTDMTLTPQWETLDAPTPVAVTEQNYYTIDTNNSTDIAISLEVAIEEIESGEGTLTYQWYRSTAANNQDGIMLVGETKSYLRIPAQSAGTVYYYCVVTYTNENYSRKKSASAVSNYAEVEVVELSDATAPIISNPESIMVHQYDPATLSTEVLNEDWLEGELSYQWYDETGELLSGETSPTVQVPTNVLGNFIYYVEVTNTNEKATGNKTVTVRSADAMVTVVAVDRFTVNYNPNGATKGSVPSDPAPHGYKEGETVTVLGNTGDLARTGYSFQGWSLNADGSGDLFKAGDTITITEDLVFYAVWKYSGGGGSGGGSGGSNNNKDDEETADPTDPTADEEWTGSELDDGGYLQLDNKNHVVYLHGYTDSTVRPDANVSRSEVAAMFYRLVANEKETIELDGTFTDVDVDAWYSQEVAYLYDHGILSGYVDGAFEPERNITRAEFVYIATKFASVKSGSIPFADVAADHWAAEAIANVYQRGWVVGYPDGTFRPDAEVTRAEAVTIINSMLGRTRTTAEVPEGASIYTDLDPSHWAYAQILEASTPQVYEVLDRL